jgi:uncharacterized repeat protein (TIGR02543 family)
MLIRMPSYKIEYYYNGEVDDSKTERGYKPVGTVITYTDKPKTGYVLEKVTPSGSITIKSLAMSDNVLRVYYVKAEYSYTVKYYYDGVHAPEENKVIPALFESHIDSYTPFTARIGYKLDDTKGINGIVGLPFDVTEISENNVIEVYYIKNVFDYTVEYYKIEIDEIENLLDDETAGEAVFGTLFEDVVVLDEIDLNAYKPVGYEDGILVNGEDVISAVVADNVIKVLYLPKTYTLTYDANGGEGSMADSEPVFDQNFTLAVNAFSKTGYTFTGWNTAANGSGTPYAASYAFTPWQIDGNLTLYAR